MIRKTTMLVVLLGLALSLVACAPAAIAPTAIPSATPSPLPAATPVVAPSPAPTPTLVTVRVRFGSPSAASDAAIYIAKEKGYFREQGIDLEVVPFASGPALVPPLAAGDLEVGGGMFGTSLLNAFARGVKMKIVADKGSSRKGFDFTWLTVRKDLIDEGKVKTPCDLKGRKVGVASVQSGAEVNVALALAQCNLTVKDVELVVMTFPDIVAAYANKAIDAAFQAEPTLTRAVEEGLAVPWKASSELYGGVAQTAVLIFSEPFAKNVEAGKRFMVAYLKGLRDYNDSFVKNKGRKEVVDILVKYTPVKDPKFYDKISMPYLDPDGKMSLEAMKLDIDYFLKSGYVGGKLVLEDILDTQFIEYAAAQLGPYR